MKSIRLLLLFFFVGVLGFSQTEEDPVLWTQEVKTLSADTYELVFKAKILDGWHVYSQFTAEGGSLPSVFTFEKAGAAYELVGKTTESETITEYSDIFEVDETFFQERGRIYAKDQAITARNFPNRCRSVLSGLQGGLHFLRTRLLAFL